MADPGEGPVSPPPPPHLFLANLRPDEPKNILETGPPPFLSVWMTLPSLRPLSQELDPALSNTS